MEFNREHAVNYARKVLRSRGCDCEQTAEDIASNALVRWYESRVRGRVQLDTIASVRYAVRDHYRSERKKPGPLKDHEERELERRTVARTSIRHLLPELDGSKKASTLRTLFRWLASGSKVVDVAKHLGCSPAYLAKLLAEVRMEFPTEAAFLAQ